MFNCRGFQCRTDLSLALIVVVLHRVICRVEVADDLLIVVHGLEAAPVTHAQRDYPSFQGTSWNLQREEAFGRTDPPRG